MKHSSKGDFKFKDGKLLFQRVGPIKAVKQKKNSRAPEKRGLWAFPYPIFDYFFVTGVWTRDGDYKRPEIDYEEKIPLSDDKRRKLEKRLKGLQRRPMGNLKSKFEEKYIHWEIEGIQEYLNTGLIPKHGYLGSGKIEAKHHLDKLKQFWWGDKIYAHFAPKGIGLSHEEAEWFCYPNAQEYLTQLRKHVVSYVKGWEDSKVCKCVASGLNTKYDIGLSADHLEVFIPYRG